MPDRDRPPAYEAELEPAPETDALRKYRELHDGTHTAMPPAKDKAPTPDPADVLMSIGKKEMLEMLFSAYAGARGYVDVSEIPAEVKLRLLPSFEAWCLSQPWVGR